MDDESGQLSKFIKRFGEGDYDLEFMESEDELSELGDGDKDIKNLDKEKKKKRKT